MLSIETRERLVRGYERTRDAKMIAQAYGVSEREVYKLAAQMRETGSVEPRTGNCGRKPKLSEEDLKRVDKAIQAQPDITFGELIRNLEWDISESRPGRIVREIGVLAEEEGDSRFGTGATPMYRKSERNGKNS